MKHLFRPVFLVVMGLVVLTGCQTDTVPPLMDVSYTGRLSDEPVLVQVIEAPGVSAEELKEAIIRATTKRGWEVTDMAEDGVLARLVHRQHDSTLTFEPADGRVEVYSVSYEIDKKTGEREIRGEPEGWIRNLHKDILTYVGALPES